MLLIIDDCAEDREAYRRYLLGNLYQSYEILEAECAEEGLDLCKQMHCEIILLDFCLPDLSGLEFLDELKRRKLEYPIPVIMLTGHGDEQVAVQAIKKGAQDYLVKNNLQPDMLQSAVRNALKQNHLQNRLNQTQQRQRFIAATALRIRQSLDLELILQTTVVEVKQLLKCDRVLVWQYLPNSKGKVVACSNPSEPIPESCLSILMAETESEYDTPQTNTQLNTQGNLIAAITLNQTESENSQIWGLLIAHQCHELRHWHPEEQDILNELSVQLAIAIQQAQLLSQTKAALGKEQELNAFKSQIVATVSHEYRTPLTSILTAASTLKCHGAVLTESQQGKLLKIIETKARHMAKLVDDMLVFNQSDLSQIKFKPLPLDLLHFCADLIEEQRAILSDQHELVFRITGNSNGFWGDPKLLRQIVTNLMSNAIKYSPHGGKIQFHLIGKDSHVSFLIQDEGMGIPLADQHNLFQSFSRGSNVDTIAGTGLGLMIAKACVELHRGEINLSSQVNQGTKVTVNLPKRIN